MDIAYRDQMIFQMKAELENRKKILCLKKRELEKNVGENHYLKEVLNDYKEYHTHIISQKNQQIEFLNKLMIYIKTIGQDLKNTDYNLKASEVEQREIIDEINKLKTELNDLVKNEN